MYIYQITVYFRFDGIRRRYWVHISQFIQPKVEFEIAFVFNKGSQDQMLLYEDVIDATAYVVAAVEVIDSRIEDWKIKFEDTVADNGSSAGAILG